MSDDWMKSYQRNAEETHPYQSVVLVKKYNKEDEARISDIFANAALNAVTRTSVSWERPRIETSVHANGGMTKRVKFASLIEKAEFEGRIQKDLTNVTALKWCLSK